MPAIYRLQNSPATPHTLPPYAPSAHIPTLPWGTDNLLPQRLIALAATSPTAANCIDQKAKFIAGQGLALLPEKPAATGMPMQQNAPNEAAAMPSLDLLWPERGAHALLHALAQSMAIFDAFALQVRYTPRGRIAEVRPVPLEQVRATATPGLYRVCPNWAAPHAPGAASTDLHAFNPADAPAQMARARALQQPYAGQLLVWPEPMVWGTYPCPAWQSAQRYAELEANLANFFANTVANAFSADLLLEVYGDFSSPAGGQSARERQEAFKERLKGFRGAQGAGEIMVLFAEEPGDLMKVHRMEPTGNDAVYQALCREAETKLCRAHQVPPVLAGILQAGRLGTASEIQDAAHYFQHSYVDDAQERIAAALCRVLPLHRKLGHMANGCTPMVLRKRATLHIPAQLYPDMTPAERRVHLLGLPAEPPAI